MSEMSLPPRVQAATLTAPFPPRAFAAFAQELGLLVTGLLQAPTACTVAPIPDDEQGIHKADEPFRFLLLVGAEGAMGWLEIDKRIGDRLVQILLGTSVGSEFGRPCRWTELETTILVEYVKDLVSCCAKA
jgi:hypothetical protein